MANTVKDTIASRLVAILAGSGVNLADVQAVRSALESAGAKAEVVAPALGPIYGTGGDRIEADKAISTVSSVMYDAVLVPSGPPSDAAPAKLEEILRFVAEAYRHGKTIGATGAGTVLLH
jgi:catalase